MGVKYRDVKFDLNTDVWPNLKIGKAHIAVEARHDCTREACHYMVQLGVTASDAYANNLSEAAWNAHKIVMPVEGANGPSNDQKFNFVSIQAPTSKVRLRMRFSPLYELWPLETGSERVAKLRPLGTDGSLLVWTQNPAKLFRYKPPVPESEETDLVGAQRAGKLELLIEGADTALNVADATDAALLGDKAYIVTGSGDLLLVDTDADDQPLDVMPWKERQEKRASLSNRTARYVEVIGGKPFAIWSDDSLECEKTRCYDYSFPSPRLVWRTNAIYDLVAIGEGTLYLARSSQLFSSLAGTVTPGLVRDFESVITAVARNGELLYVSLENGEIWKREGNAWAPAIKLDSPVGAIGIWNGGAEEKRALTGFSGGTDEFYEANRLWGESVDGLWWANRLLPIPALRTVNGVTGMQSSLGPPPYSGESDSTNLESINDSMVIGTTGSGLLYVYTRTHLDRRYGAFEACSIGVPRIVPVIG